MTHKTLRKIFHNTIINKYKEFKKKKHKDILIKKAYLYNQKKNIIINTIKEKDIKKILFFVLNMGMWKYDGLIKLLIDNPNFEVTVVSFDMPQLNKENSKKEQYRIEKYCNINGITFIKGYDYDLEQYTDIIDLKPDIVIYTQPYDIGYKHWLIDAFREFSIFIYTPYGACVTSGKHFYDTYLTNIAWKIFTGSEYENQIIIQNRTVLENNIVFVGYSIYDNIKNPNSTKNPWKSIKKKKIIWAPHHSIDSINSFTCSNFEQICNNMIEIAKKYKNLIEFAFKPHPILKERLLEKWGVERTEKYYMKWQSMSNTFLCEGDYTELFAYSDGMIHDCASFVCEYLITNKPAMYLVKDNKIPSGVDNDYGIECFNQHYHGNSINDIENFIETVILNNDDPMKNQREIFVHDQFTPPNGMSVAENMMKELMVLVKK